MKNLIIMISLLIFFSVPVFSQNYSHSFKKGDSLYAWVDKLRVRRSPNFKSSTVEIIPQGAEVIYTGALQNQRLISESKKKKIKKAIDAKLILYEGMDKNCNSYKLKSLKRKYKCDDEKRGVVVAYINKSNRKYGSENTKTYYSKGVHQSYWDAGSEGSQYITYSFEMPENNFGLKFGNTIEDFKKYFMINGVIEDDVFILYFGESYEYSVDEYKFYFIDNKLAGCVIRNYWGD